MAGSADPEPTATISEALKAEATASFPPLFKVVGQLANDEVKDVNIFIGALLLRTCALILIYSETVTTTIHISRFREDLICT